MDNQIHKERERKMNQDSALTEKMWAFSKCRGADLFGVADLVPAEKFVLSQGPSWFSGFPRAISIGMRLNDPIVDHHSPLERRRDSQYWHHVYDVVTPSLDFLAYDVSRQLNSLGFQAFPVPGSMPYPLEKLEGMLSHKLAAHLAGLGWVGKSCLLITPQFGPRVRFVSILTDAPLVTGAPLDNPCGKCRICVDACPVGAFTGRDFDPAEGVEARFDTRKCSEYRREHPCGICVAVCPRGKSGRVAMPDPTEAGKQESNTA